MFIRLTMLDTFNDVCIRVDIIKYIFADASHTTIVTDDKVIKVVENVDTIYEYLEELLDLDGEEGRF